MISKVFTVKNQNGLHARPAAMLVQLCSKFSSEIMMKKENSMINAKSIIGVMGLAVSSGSDFEIIVEGDDEIKAMEEISKFVEENL